MSHLTPRVLALVTATYLCYSTCDAFSRLFMMRGYGSYQSLFLAMSFGLIPIFAFLAHQKKLTDLIPRHKRFILFRVGVSCAELACAFYTLGHLPLAQCYALFFTMPLWAALFSALFLGEHLRKRQRAAIGLGFIGVLVANNIGGEAWVFSTAHLTGLLTAMLAAGSLVLVRYLGAKEKQAVLMTAHYFGLITFGAVMTGSSWQPMPLADWATIAIAGLGSGFAQVMFVLTLQYAPAPLVAPFQYTQVFWALIYGTVLFSDPIDAHVLAGLCLIILGGWWLLHLSKKPKQRAVS